MIYKLLKQLKIEYIEIKHNPIHTIEEALKEKIPKKIDGLECKNLFLKSKNNYFLILIKSNKQADINYLSKLLNVSHLTFASKDELKEILNLQPGSVTPLGLINDKNNLVTLLIDKELENQKILLHPNTNTKTLSLKEKDLIKIIEAISHKHIYF